MQNANNSDLIPQPEAVIQRWFRLGRMFASSDPVEAKRWIDKAATYGHSEAIALARTLHDTAKKSRQEKTETWYQLGLFYSDEGKVSDHTEARKWFSMAARNGHPKAADALQ